MIELNINQEILDKVGFSLLHTTWIAALLILVAAVMIQFNHSKSSSWKSNVILITMMSILMAVVSLMFVYNADAVIFTGNQELFVASNMASETGLVSSNEFQLSKWIEHNKSTMILIWLGGVILFSIKYLFSFIMLTYVRKLAILENDSKFHNLIASVSSKLKYEGKKIQLAYSGLVTSPMVSGVFKPMIIFPIGLINQLSYEEVEGIIAHEISHLIRKDHLANFLIVTLEIIFYYHPGVWWLNSQLKKYREEDCDDRAVAILNGNITYIKTLVKLQERTLSGSNGLSLAMNGSNDSNFYKRIKRLMNMDIKNKSIKNHFAAIGLILIVGMCYTQSKLNAKDLTLNEDLEFQKESSDLFQPLLDAQYVSFTDTLPTKGLTSTKIIQKNNDQEVEIELQDGEVTTLKIDGKVIPKDKYGEHKDKLDNIRSDKSGFYFGNGHSLAPPNMDIKRFENELGESFIMSFGDAHKGIGHRIDSLVNIIIGDSTFAYSFGHRFPHNREQRRFDIQGFPEGFNFEDFDRLESFSFPQNFEFNIQELGDNTRDLEIQIEGLRKRKNDGFGWNKEENKLEDIIGSQLNKDGFLLPNKENTVLLTGKYLKINGEKQPNNIWNKYKSLFENETGVPLHKKSRLEFSIIGKQSNKRYKAF